MSMAVRGSGQESDQGTGARRPQLAQGSAYKVLALQVELCLPRLIASRIEARRRRSGFRPGFWPQGQSNQSPPRSRLSALSPDPVG
jgi:hypothetical protein